MTAPTVEEIAAATGAAFSVSYADLVAPARGPARLALVRQSAMWLAAGLCPASYDAIGKELGGRDRTTIRHGIAAIERRLRRVRKGCATAADRGLAVRLDELRLAFREGQ